MNCLELKEKFLSKCNDRMKNTMNDAFKLENTFGKYIFELNYNEAEKIIEMMQEDRTPAIRMLKTYTSFAIKQGYSITNVNVFDLM